LTKIQYTKGRKRFGESYTYKETVTIREILKSKQKKTSCTQLSVVRVWGEKTIQLPIIGYPRYFPSIELKKIMETEDFS
jgi:hypothetical protein